MRISYFAYFLCGDSRIAHYNVHANLPKSTNGNQLILSLNCDYTMNLAEIKEKHTSQGLLCFGGSFNPLHYGHLQCCRKVAEVRGFARTLLIPSANPPHKVRLNDMATATDRLAMCRIAAADYSALDVSDIEQRRHGPSYTYDTVLSIRAETGLPVYWLIGADMLMMLPKWYRASDLIRQATILVIRRPGVELAWDALPDEFQHLKENQVDAPLIDISATDIRRRIRAHEPIDTLVPPGVARYIHKNNLYQCEPGRP